MTRESGAQPPPGPLADEGAQDQDVLGLGERDRQILLAWVGDNLPQVRQSVSGQRVLYWSLGVAFALGLAAHVGGFLLKASVTTEPLALVADLFYALGWALWTGVVVVVFVEVYPEAKRRQYKQALDAYEEALRHGPVRDMPHVLDDIRKAAESAAQVGSSVAADPPSAEDAEAAAP